MIITPDMELLVAQMKAHALKGFYQGHQWEIQMPYFNGAKRVHVPSGTMMIFTRDRGPHSAGWWKNPDYEYCFHLSMSFWDLENRVPVPFEHKHAEVWCRLFYHGFINLIWEEPATSEAPHEIFHYRVFCNAAWEPIMPRGEVYTRDYTPAGWKSWSERTGDESWTIMGEPGEKD